MEEEEVEGKKDDDDDHDHEEEEEEPAANLCCVSTSRDLNKGTDWFQSLCSSPPPPPPPPLNLTRGILLFRAGFHSFQICLLVARKKSYGTLKEVEFYGGHVLVHHTVLDQLLASPDLPQLRASSFVR
ncbi:hypothetical protein E2C01_093774 [Portunus trituberculatus]|uniref:Uncharacterized protein n=1 Tax=Portunus trituberculatus TaxID=210409 RepID=A0A5B7JV36_PORTR|nr:hypothetical protein [Portunus trituberculatus]